MVDKTHTFTSIDAAEDTTMMASADIMDHRTLALPTKDANIDVAGRTEAPVRHRTRFRITQSCSAMILSTAAKVAPAVVFLMKIEGQGPQRSSTKKTWKSSADRPTPPSMAKKLNEETRRLFCSSRTISSLSTSMEADRHS